MQHGDVVEGPDGPTTLGPVGQEVVFENDAVRVWSIELAPGEEQTWHHHANPYVVVALQAADNRIDPLDGSEPRFVREEVGGVVYRAPGEIHKLTNHGSSTYLSRLVELKVSEGDS
jgi:predicted metal-dependent enzyme (double-stranded beta helix superfamily)